MTRSATGSCCRWRFPLRPSPAAPPPHRRPAGATSVAGGGERRTSNVQRSTSNPDLDVRRWTLDVGRSPARRAPERSRRFQPPESGHPPPPRDRRVRRIRTCRYRLRSRLGQKRAITSRREDDHLPDAVACVASSWSAGNSILDGESDSVRNSTRYSRRPPTPMGPRSDRVKVLMRNGVPPVDQLL